MNFFRIYDRLAHTYDLALGPMLKPGQKMAVHAMDLKPGFQVLEVGIGTGLTLSLYPPDIHITGIDLSEPMLKKAEEKVVELGLKNTKLQVMSGEALRFEDNSFDAVFAPSVFSVVDDPRKVLDEMVRVCKPDGVICVVSHFAGSTWVHQTFDRMTDPWTRKWVGFRMTTSRDVVEAHAHSKIILKKPILLLNFGTLYLLKKK